MSVKRGILTALSLCIILTLSGCVDAMPDMTQEETDEIAEYAATILLKHSNNYNYRLVDEEELERSIFEDNQAMSEAIENLKKEEAKKDETDEPIKDSSSESEADSKLEESDSDAETETENSGDSDTISVDVKAERYLSKEDLAGYLGINDCYSIEYIGKETSEVFPTQNTNSGFQISAAKGNTLLVLHFNLKNITDSKLYCDMMEVNPTFKIDVNKSGFTKIENTLLMNDFVTFMDDVKAGETVELVTIIEIPDEEITDLKLQIKSGNAYQEFVVD